MPERKPDISRRRVLQAGLGASALFLPVPYAWVWAQSEGALKLLRLPKVALVLGNSNYVNVTTLNNPGNDARAISDLLRRSGFDVVARLDATLDDMAGAVATYVKTLAARKAVGLFYFAGHGVQLAWRNYLVPVDAAVHKQEDIPKTCIDLTRLMEGINKAANPMNVVILDACRENPFAAEVRAEGRGLTVTDAPGSTQLYAIARNEPVGGEIRGLSQMDAPQGTLLAYATAPGHVASDGTGANGLYTENLLREMRVPEAKIEDIFKRVRLHVRRRTNGQQIPWESTSLEEDFYFVPPQALSTQADEEAERERRQEMALREKRRAEEEAERKRKQEQALREARLAAEEAERKRRQELALFEKQRIAEEAERKRKQELALKEAQRVAEAAERKRREEQAIQEAKLAEEAAARKYKQELAQSEQRRAEEEAARKRKEAQALREAKQAEEEAARKYQQELALREKRLAQEEAERRRKQQAVEIRKPDIDLAERQFEEELAIWEKIKSSKESASLEDYLLRYPSGQFSELAELRLDQVLAQQGEKRIEVVSDAKNPYTQGSARVNTNYKVGDSYTYRTVDSLTRLQQGSYTQTVVEVGDTEIFYDTGLVTDLLGNRLRARDRERAMGDQGMPLEFAVGKRWSSRYNLMPLESGGRDDGRGRGGGKGRGGGRGEGKGGGGGAGRSIEMDFRIVIREQVTVPAGTFNAFRIRGQGWVSAEGRKTRQIDTEINIWLAPAQLRRPVIVEVHRQAEGAKRNGVKRMTRDELVTFKES